MRVVVLCHHPFDRAPGNRLRFEQYYDSWRRAGYEVDVRSFWSMRAWAHLYEPKRRARKALGVLGGVLRRGPALKAAFRADVVYLALGAAPVGPPVLERLIKRKGIPIVYDLDDFIQLPHSSRFNPLMRWLRPNSHVPELVQLADHVVVGTEHVRQYALRHNQRVTTIPATIDMERYRPRPHREGSQGIVVGWTGSHSTSPYLHLLDDVLRGLQKDWDIGVKVIGDGGFSIEGVHVDAQPWRLTTEIADLSEIDIGVYPLPHEEWALGKSGGKALQYMALCIPTVAQRFGANVDIIDHGSNGFLAGSADEWRDMLERLITDPALRQRTGDAGRQTVVERFSTAVWEPVYLGILREVLRETSRETADD